MQDQMQEEAQAFKAAMADWLKAGEALVEAWDGERFHADEVAPLPDALRPPMSLDDWFMALRVHYEQVGR